MPVLMVLLISPGTALWHLGVPVPVYVGLLAVSLVTAALVAVDKSQAQNSGKRIPELLLHFLELAGGWPGSLVARNLKRHKTVKFSYRLVFAAIVSLYQAASLYYLYHQFF